jgi:hypothetical protein
MASNIVIADAQATPVNHTFVPIGRDAQNRFWFVDQSATNAVGFWRISIREKHPGNPAPGQTTVDRVYRYEFALHEPVLAVVGNNAGGYQAVPRVDYITRFVGDYILPEASTLQNRADIAKMFPLLLQNSQVTGLVTSLAFLS